MWGAAYWNPYAFLQGILAHSYSSGARAGVLCLTFCLRSVADKMPGRQLSSSLHLPGRSLHSRRRSRTTSYVRVDGISSSISSRADEGLFRRIQPSPPTLPAYCRVTSPLSADNSSASSWRSRLLLGQSLTCSAVDLLQATDFDRGRKARRCDFERLLVIPRRVQHLSSQRPPASAAS